MAVINSRVFKYPIYYFLVSFGGVVLRTNTPGYERGDIIPSCQLRGIYTHTMLVRTGIELLFNTLHYVD